jgi:hypothetical protein
MISDAIVWASVAFAAAFVAAWAASPTLRDWIERPKHQFLASTRQYDAAAQPGGPAADPRTP